MVGFKTALHSSLDETLRNLLEEKNLGGQERGIGGEIPRIQVGLNQLASLGVILRDSVYVECGTFTCIQFSL